VPLARNRDIDARRAQLWRATYDQQLAQPEIRRQLIEFVREASITYWIWVAAGRKYEIGQTALQLAEDRNEGFARRVQQGDLDPPVLKDNERAIASREAKVIDLERKLKQSAVKLSLFYRTSDGTPLIPAAGQAPNFPEPMPIDPACYAGDIAMALAMRPELESLDLLRRRTEVDAAEASNDLLPNVDAQVVGSQDVGQPTSEKRDKSQFELEVGVFVDVPVQRRKGFGKLGATQGKLAQLAAKRQFTEDKITAEVQAVYAGLLAAYDRVAKTREAREGAALLATVERRKLELGESDLLAVFQREQLAVEAADDEVEALLEYFIARADYAAALAYEWVDHQSEPQKTKPQ
jgi:outer membrane protein TolC